MVTAAKQGHRLIAQTPLTLLALTRHRVEMPDESWFHASLHKRFNQERHLVYRQTYRNRRSAGLTEWRSTGLSA